MEKIELVCTNDELFEKIVNGSNVNLNEAIPFILLVDNVPVVKYDVVLHKFNPFSKGIACSEIEFSNFFHNSIYPEELQKYLGKGYVKQGLNMLVDYIFNKNISYIYLNIKDDNLAAIKVALGCDFVILDDTFFRIHPNAKELFISSLGLKQGNKLNEIIENFDAFIDAFNLEKSRFKK